MCLMDQLTLTPAHEIPMFKSQMANVLVHGETVNDVGVERHQQIRVDFQMILRKYGVRK